MINDIIIIPYHLRDATSNSMKKNNDMISGDITTDYLYPHSYEGSYVKQQYLPDSLKDKEYFEATTNGKDTFSKK